MKKIMNTKAKTTQTTTNAIDIKSSVLALLNAQNLYEFNNFIYAAAKEGDNVIEVHDMPKALHIGTILSNNFDVSYVHQKFYSLVIITAKS
jgi:hypothetical protein